MTTRYGIDPLPIMASLARWHAQHVADGGDLDDGNAWAQFTVSAEDAAQAEARVLSVVAFDYENDMRGATAQTYGKQISPEGESVWRVLVNFAMPR